MHLRLVPLATGLLPILAIHICYLLAINYASLPVCIPYLEGCTSISATGRYPPASYLFKAVMLPTTVLLCVYWLLNVSWLRALERAAGTAPGAHRAVSGFGVGGAVCLVLYVTFLGSAEPFYEFMRRFGVYLYFLLSVIAQLILAARSMQAARHNGNVTMLRLSSVQLALAALPFVLGILNLVLKAVLENADRPENVIEWYFALMMQLYFLLTWGTWRSTGFDARYEVSSGR